jgi:hypothetical protein
VLSISHRAQRLPVRPIVGNLGKGSGVVKGLVSREGAHFLGCDRCMGNEGLWANCNSGQLRQINYVESHTLVCHQKPFFPSGFGPHLGGDILLKIYEQQCLWLGGTSESRPQLVIFIKDKYSLCACLVYCVLVYLCLTLG